MVTGWSDGEEMMNELLAVTLGGCSPLQELYFVMLCYTPSVSSLVAVTVVDSFDLNIIIWSLPMLRGAL